MIFLVDNGSIRAAAYVNLCGIAKDLSIAIEEMVTPAPLLHANKIPPDELENESPHLLEELLADAYDRGLRDFTVLPLFFGPSSALVDYLPRRFKKFSNTRNGFSIRILNPLVSDNEDGAAKLTKIVRERVLEVAYEFSLKKFSVILVDHGSPRKEVTEVRNRIARLLGRHFEAEDVIVSPASMERRAGAEYDFNEPLLAKALSEAPHSIGDTVIAHLFFSPGRHAGPNGDIVRICAKAEKENLSLRTYRTELVGGHKKLIDLLKFRWDERNEIPKINY